MTICFLPIDPGIRFRNDPIVPGLFAEKDGKLRRGLPAGSIKPFYAFSIVGQGGGAESGGDSGESSVDGVGGAGFAPADDRFYSLRIQRPIGADKMQAHTWLKRGESNRSGRLASLTRRGGLAGWLFHALRGLRRWTTYNSNIRAVGRRSPEPRLSNAEGRTTQ
jgi:hypothetical protein